MTFSPALRRQRRVDLQSILVYKSSYRIARVTQRNPVSEKKGRRVSALATMWRVS